MLLDSPKPRPLARFTRPATWDSIRYHQTKFHHLSSATIMHAAGTAAHQKTGHQKTLGQAIWQITIADVSMSLDNVLAVVFFSSRRRHTRSTRDWSSDVCSSD